MDPWATMELVYSTKVFDLVERDDLSQAGHQPAPMDDNYTSLEWFQAMLNTLPGTLPSEPMPPGCPDTSTPYFNQNPNIPPTSSSSYCLDPDFNSTMLYTETPSYTDTAAATSSPDWQNLDFFSTKSSTSPSLGTFSTGSDFSMNSESSQSSASLPDVSESPIKEGHVMTPVKKSAPSRPCDLKRQRRKVEKPERCKLCPKRYPFKRELNRHMIVHHKSEAKARGLPMERIRCSSCSETFARKDHLTRHLKSACKGSYGLSLM